jgi:hypothetical protein
MPHVFELPPRFGNRGSCQTHVCSFFQLSHGAKSVLEDLIARLTRLQTLTRKLRSAEIDEEMERKLLDTGRFRIVAVGEGEGGAITQERARGESEVVTGEAASESRIMRLEPAVIEIDLFG